MQKRTLGKSQKKIDFVCNSWYNELYRIIILAIAFAKKSIIFLDNKGTETD